MAVIITNKTDTLDKLRLNVNALSNLIGDSLELQSLSNENNVIDAIKEISGSSLIAEVAVKKVVEGAVDWTFAPYASNNTIDTTGFPAYLKYTKTANSITEYVKCALTWGVSGGAENNVTIAAYSYSLTDSNYQLIKTQTITYDNNGNVSNVSWS